jgi:VCBS repeat protein/fibronectin type III domain protein
MPLLMRPASRFAAIIIVMLATGATAAAQTSVTLAWDPNTETNIAGYAIYYGTSAGNWPTAVNVGNVTQTTVSGLTRGQTYYFIARAYNTDGAYSGPSVEVTAQIPYIDGTVSPTAPGLELMFQHTDGRLASMRFQGFTQVGLTEMVPTVAGDPLWKVVGLADFNRDGRRDILWQHENTALLAIWLMNGTALVDGAMVNPSSPGDVNWRVAAVGDLDGDGNPDIVFRHRVSDDMAVWFLNGFNLRDGSMLTPSRVVDRAWRIMSAADLDGDGKADLLWQHTDGSLAAWLMNGSYLKDGAQLFPNRVTDPAWTLMGTGQANTDGKADLVWRHSQSGALAVWLMDRFWLVDGAGLTTLPMGAGWRLVGSR